MKQDVSSAKRPRLAEDATSALWREGSLHLRVSAPRTPYAQRMTIAPVSLSAGDYVAVMPPWCGDKLYAHEALRKAAVNIDLVVLGQLFTVVPMSLAQGSTSQRSTDLPADTVRPANVCKGILAQSKSSNPRGQARYNPA